MRKKPNIFLETSRSRFAKTRVQLDIFNNNKTIFEAWKYETLGRDVDFPVARQELLDATKVYREKVSAAEVPANYKTTKTGCANEDCVVVAKSLIDQGLNPAILNLADAYHAYGKYNGGASAQEESLCRASTLSLTLYQFREGHEHNNLEYRSEDGGFNEEGEGIMRDKIRTIYRIALLNGHDSLVLGAFGCGVFKLKLELVSALFKEILDEKEFKGKFHTIVFALMEGPAGLRRRVEEEGKLGAFYEKFGKWE